MKMLLLSLLALFLFGCGSPQTAKNEGSGSEIVGVVQTTDSKTASVQSRGLIPVNRAQIFLLNVGHYGTGAELPEVLTSSDGSFGIKSANPGEWFVEAFDPTKNLSRIKRISVKGDGKQINVGVMDVVTPATVHCAVNMKLPVNMSYEIYVLGTRSFGKGNQDNLNLTLQNIPVGTQLTVQLKVLSPYPTTMEQTINLSQGGSANLDFTLPF